MVATEQRCVHCNSTLLEHDIDGVLRCFACQRAQTPSGVAGKNHRVEHSPNTLEKPVLGADWRDAMRARLRAILAQIHAQEQIKAEAEQIHQCLVILGETPPPLPWKTRPAKRAPGAATGNASGKDFGACAVCQRTFTHPGQKRRDLVTDQYVCKRCPDAGAS